MVDGYTLLRSSGNATGFVGVSSQDGKYKAAAADGKKGKIYLGMYPTPEEAALAFAKHTAEVKEAEAKARAVTEEKEAEVGLVTEAEGFSVSSSPCLQSILKAGVRGYENGL